MNSLRLFVAAYPPTDVVSLLMGHASGLLPRDAKPTTPDQLHLTLLFLGNVRASDVAAVSESIDRAASGRVSCELVLHGVGCLPEVGEPRLLAALGDANGNLLELQRRLASRLSTVRPRASRDKFTPHLTLARFQPGTARTGMASIEPVRWAVQAVRLMRSDLRPSGAVHTLVHEASLDG